MINGLSIIPEPKNEPVYSYAPGTNERELLLKEIHRQIDKKVEIPLIIGGKEITTENIGKAVRPDNHGHLLATYHKAGLKEVSLAAKSTLDAKKDWESLPWINRASIFLKAAEIISKKYRYILNAATMLNMSKNVFQAEIDSTCELADFFRFNPQYMLKIYQEQPNSTSEFIDRLEYRPLEGFFFAATPFNFTSIAGNLPTAPALMGNTVVRKPASNAVLPAYPAYSSIVNLLLFRGLYWG